MTISAEQIAKVVADAINAHGFQFNDNPPTLKAGPREGFPNVVEVANTNGGQHWVITVDPMRV